MIRGFSLIQLVLMLAIGSILMIVSLRVMKDSGDFSKKSTKSNDHVRNYMVAMDRFIEDLTKATSINQAASNNTTLSFTTQKASALGLQTRLITYTMRADCDNNPLTNPATPCLIRSKDDGAAVTSITYHGVNNLAWCSNYTSAAVAQTLGDCANVLTTNMLPEGGSNTSGRRLFVQMDNEAGRKIRFVVNLISANDDITASLDSKIKFVD